jgi:hypothetical protein
MFKVVKTEPYFKTVVNIQKIKTQNLTFKAIVDENGNYIVDENGNYIIYEE